MGCISITVTGSAFCQRRIVVVVVPAVNIRNRVDDKVVVQAFRVQMRRHDYLKPFSPHLLRQLHADLVCLLSVSYIDGKHYHDNKKNLRLLRQRSDELCREYSLSVIEHPSGRKKPYVLTGLVGSENRENLTA